MQYNGRLMCDCYGNLLADEGPRAGEPVAWTQDGTYEFVNPGEPSHNELWEQKVAEVVPTQEVDPELPGYAGDADNPTEGNEHHFDPPGEPRFDADKVAAKVTSHTDA